MCFVPPALIWVFPLIRMSACSWGQSPLPARTRNSASLNYGNSHQVPLVTVWPRNLVSRSEPETTTNAPKSIEFICWTCRQATLRLCLGGWKTGYAVARSAPLSQADFVPAARDANNARSISDTE